MKRCPPLSSVLLTLLLLTGLHATAADKIKVMFLTGQSSKYHNWALSSQILKRILQAPGIFAVDTITSPPAGADMAGFHPAFTHYKVVVVDYEGAEWPAATEAAFEDYMKNGGGLVSYHDTDNSFPDWKAWNEMIGVGGWEGRTAACGPKVRWRDGKMVLDDSPGTAQHPPKHDFDVEIRDPNQPITKRLPEKWMHANDELYSQLRGPAQHLHVLATATADPAKFKAGTGENEPMLMTITYGQGRVFHITLGHVGPADNESVASVNCAGFQTVFQRGTEWAATGKVTLPIPADFPTADKTSVRQP